MHVVNRNNLPTLEVLRSPLGGLLVLWTGIDDGPQYVRRLYMIEFGRPTKECAQCIEQPTPDRTLFDALRANNRSAKDAEATLAAYLVGQYRMAEIHHTTYTTLPNLKDVQL